MNLAEACELARVVNQNRRFMVLAVSRYELMEELAKLYVAGRESEVSWAVTVACVDDIEYRDRLTSESQWRDYAAGAPKASAAKPVPQPAAPATPQEKQFTLF